MFFTTAGLMAEASAKTGLKDFGSNDFVEGFELLLADINDQGAIPEDRLEPVRQLFLRLLINRLWFQKDLLEHPEILDEDLVSPVVITSLPRTGTTKLHWLLSATNSFHGLPLWKGHMFARIPGEEEGGAAKRIQETRKYEQWLTETVPEFMAGHPVHTESPEEELILTEYTFKTVYMPSRFNAPNYSAWLMQSDIQPTYDYLQKQLQYLQWQFHQNDPKPWLLKSPSHLGWESHLLSVLPNDTKLIFPHRDVTKCLPSTMRTCQLYMQLYNGNTVPNEAIAELMLGSLSQLMKQHMAWRDENPDVPILDLGFTEINADSLGTAKKVFDFLEIELTPKMEKRIIQWDKDHPRGKAGRISYSLEMFGLNKQIVESAFADYRDRFGYYL